MSQSFDDYDTARRAAGDKARLHGMDVALRAGKEFGRMVYRVSFASRNDSDYALAEIIHPTDPAWN